MHNKSLIKTWSGSMGFLQTRLQNKYFLSNLLEKKLSRGKVLKNIHRFDSTFTQDALGTLLQFLLISVKNDLECSSWKLDIPGYTSTTLPSSHRDQMTIVTKQVMPGSFFYIHQFKGPRSHKWEESLVQREMFARGRQSESQCIY